MPRSSLPSSSNSAGPSSSPRARRTPVVELPASRQRSSSRPTASSPLAHRTTDEIALLEADKILRTGPKAQAYDLESMQNPRNARHRHLEEARRKAEEEAEQTGGDDEEEEGDREVSPALTSGLIVDRSLDQGSSAAVMISEDEEEEEEEIEQQDAGPSVMVIGHIDGDSSASGSDEDSDETSSGSSDTDTDSDEDDDGDEEMERLLAAAKAAAIARAAKEGEGGGDGFAAQDDVLELHVETKDDLPIPDISIPNMPKSHLQFSLSGTAKASRPEPVASSSSRPTSKPRPRSREAEHGLELDDRPYEKSMSKKERQAQPKKASTSELWAILPSTKSDLLPQMKRDYQALSLANSLDPKRFMKGNNKLTKVPERFAIGTIVDAPRTLHRTTLQKEYRYRPGEIVKDLVKDQEAEGYAKRKYEELQWAKMDQGRKKGFRKRGKW